MLTLAFILIFLAGMLFVVGVRYKDIESRPTLKMYGLDLVSEQGKKKAVKLAFAPADLIRWIAVINKPLVTPLTRQQLFKNIAVGMTPEEFFLIKEVTMAGLVVVLTRFMGADLFFMAIFFGLGAGWVLPDMWLRSKINRIKDDIIKTLPDTVDLLGLCVNAGLDFMMALKWVVEKSSATPLIVELNNVLQEINVGKPRRDALRDLAKKYELPDLSTFARTLIQADKMGTSVSEALNILSEDMRLARYRRGEAMAMKAPLKMLVPLLFCIFPVVGILVAAPVFLDFMLNNPLKAMGGG